MELHGYLSNQLGFSQTGNFVLDKLIKPKINDAQITILDPFEEVGKELNLSKVGKIKVHQKVIQYWRTFNEKVTPINNKLMESADCMLAILDGGHAVDDGVASEIGYYAGLNRGPIFALRSDLRLAENVASKINPQVEGYIIQSGGALIDGPNALERWANTIDMWAQKMFKENKLATA